MARVEAKTLRVGRWRTSDQKQRGCAATLIRSETNVRRVNGYTHLALLHAALRVTLPVNTTAAYAAMPRHSPEFQRGSGHTLLPANQRCSESLNSVGRGLEMTTHPGDRRDERRRRGHGLTSVGREHS